MPADEWVAAAFVCHDRVAQITTMTVAGHCRAAPTVLDSHVLAQSTFVIEDLL